MGAIQSGRDAIIVGCHSVTMHAQGNQILRSIFSDIAVFSETGQGANERIGSALKYSLPVVIRIVPKYQVVET